MDSKVSSILKSTSIVVRPEVYSVIAVSRQLWQELLGKPECSPRMTDPFLIFYDAFEVTLILDEADLRLLEPELTEAKIERGYRMLTFDVELEFNVVGFLAAVSGVLAEAGIPILSASSFSRDHLYVRQADLQKVLNVLRPLVAVPS